MHAIHTDSSGLTTLWDPIKKCYCFEDAAGHWQPFTLTPHSGDHVLNGHSGPTIEALIACAAHRLAQYDACAPCEENNNALKALSEAQGQLLLRFARLSQGVS